MEELFPCCSQKSGFREIRVRTVCFGLEEHTTKIPWFRWSGRRRCCWWRRRSLGASNLKVEATFHFRTLGSGKGEILQSWGGAGSRWIHACWTACLHQEPGFCASWEIEKGTIGRCQRERKNCQVIGPGSSLVSSPWKPTRSVRACISILQSRFNKGPGIWHRRNK